MQEMQEFDPRVGEIPWRRAWQPTPVFLPGESPGQRSLVEYSPWGHTVSDMTEVSEHIRMQKKQKDGDLGQVKSKLGVKLTLKLEG